MDLAEKIQKLKKEKKAIEKQAGMPFEQVVEQHKAFKPPEPEAPKIAKNSSVIAPQGVGEVKEIRGENAIVEVDGKKHKVPVEELEAPAFTDEEVADKYDALFAAIPESERSGFISWSGYDENLNKLGFIPRGGKYEELFDITPEEAQQIKEGTGTARTSGEVREGLWVAGEETRGGVISQIIDKRKKQAQALEERQLKLFPLPKAEKQDRGMKPIFDELAYARAKSQEREKRLKAEERAKKKAEKKAARDAKRRSKKAE